MKEIKLTAKNYVAVMQEALDVLRSGGVIIYPTETSYGMGCDYYDAKAVARIYAIKNREDRAKPLPVLVPDIISATYLVEFSEKSRRLALEHWPGPLTLILPFKHKKWQPHFNKCLALRVSSHPFANSLTINLGRPLVATSANITGKGDCFSDKDINKQFKGQENLPDLFINAGVLPKKKPTTIVKCDLNKDELLRKGEIEVKI